MGSYCISQPSQVSWQDNVVLQHQRYIQPIIDYFPIDI